MLFAQVVFKYSLYSLGNASFSCKLRRWARAQRASSPYCTACSPRLTCTWCRSAGVLIFDSTLLCLEKDNETLQGGWEDCCAFTANGIVAWLNDAKIPARSVGWFKIRRLTDLDRPCCLAPLLRQVLCILRPVFCYSHCRMFHLGLSEARSRQCFQQKRKSHVLFLYNRIDQVFSNFVRKAQRSIRLGPYHKGWALTGALPMQDSLAEHLGICFPSFPQYGIVTLPGRSLWAGAGPGAGGAGSRTLRLFTSGWPLPGCGMQLTRAPWKSQLGVSSRLLSKTQSLGCGFRPRDTFLARVVAAQMFQQSLSSYLLRDHSFCNEPRMIRQSSTSQKSNLTFLYKGFYLCLDFEKFSAKSVFKCFIDYSWVSNGRGLLE